MRRLVVLLLIGAVVAAGEVIVAARVTRPLPAPEVRLNVPGSLVLAAGTPPAPPHPATGSLYVASDASGELAAYDADTQRPIASVAKTMTALVVLRMHPIAAGAEGPLLTLTEADVASYQQAIANQGSAVAVTSGEQLSERQLLLALLLPSANNIADTLARWVAGSVPAFTVMENAEAVALGMTRTHFDDASGVSTQTVSTARDLVSLARAALGIPALSGIVATRTAALPDGTQLRNLDIELGSDADWVGLKTGWTPAAGGCLLFAARHSYASGVQPVTVYGAVLAQGQDASTDPDHPELGAAFASARAAVAAATAGYAAVQLASLHPNVTGAVSEPWGASSPVIVLSALGVVVARLGASVQLSVVPARPAVAPARGSTVGFLAAHLDGATVAVWPLESAQSIGGPGFWWRLWRA